MRTVDFDAGIYTSAVIVSNPVLRHRFGKMLDSLDISGGNVFGIAAFEAASDCLPALYILSRRKLTHFSNEALIAVSRS